MRQEEVVPVAALIAQDAVDQAEALEALVCIRAVRVLVRMPLEALLAVRLADLSDRRARAQAEDRVEARARALAVLERGLQLKDLDVVLVPLRGGAHDECDDHEQHTEQIHRVT